MRIGLFTDTYPPFINGVSTSVLMLKKALEKKNHQVFIVTVNNESISYQYDEKEKVLRIPSIPIGIYDYRVSGFYPIKAANMIKKWKLDVIHSHTEFGIGTFARIIAKQFNIPLVHTYHTMYEDYIYYITKGYFDGVSKKIVEYITLFYCDKTISELVVPTKKTYDLFVEKYNVSRNIHIVPTGIDIDKFYRENFDKKDVLDLRNKVGLDKKDFVLLYVGRIASEKNIEYLIDAQKQIYKSKGDIKLVFIGDGPDLEKYRKMVIEKGLEGNVMFLGKVPYNEIGKYYQLANVFVTASQTETQGLTVIEAMAASIPVVAINDESFNQVVVNELNGFCFNNKRQYRDAVFQLHDNINLYNKCKNQARITASSYSSKYYAERILDVYEVALKNHKLKKENIIFKIQRVVKKNKKDSNRKSKNES